MSVCVGGWGWDDGVTGMDMWRAAKKLERPTGQEAYCT